MGDRESRFAKNILIITLGRISTQFVSFLLLPLYTAILSTSEYGTVDFVNTLIQFLIPVETLMIDQGVFRFLLTCEDKTSKKRIVSGAIVVQTSLNTLVFLVGLLLYISNKNQYLIWSLLILVATSYNNIILQIARGIKRTFDYALGSFLCSSITIALNVVFLVGLKIGAIGMLYAAFFGTIMAALLIGMKMKIYKYISFKECSKAEIRQLVYYSIPFVPNQLSIWVLSSSDRIIVTLFLGVAANGILAVSHKFPIIYMTFFNVVLLAWHETGAVHYFDDDRDLFFSDIINKLISFFSVCCIGIIIVIPSIFGWIVNQSYYEAYYNIPIYLVASLFNVVIGLLGVIYVATKKTGEIAKTTILAAVINIVVNILLIKWIGLYAASISTLVGYLITLIYRIYDSKKYINIVFDVKNVMFILFFLSVSIVVYYSENKIFTLICIPVFIVSVYWHYRKLIHKMAYIIISKIRNEEG